MGAVTAPFRIVFVCMGNICRSPTADVVMRSLLEQEGLSDRVKVASAGTGDWHVGQGIDPRAGEVLSRAGYDGSRHRAQQFAPEWFDRFDLIVAMDRKNRWFLEQMAPSSEAREKIRMLRSYDPDAARRGDLDVPDPYYDDGFDQVLKMVEVACHGLLDEVRTRLAADTVVDRQHPGDGAR